MRQLTRVFVGFSGLILAGLLHAMPAALVEDVGDDVGGVQLLDFLVTGQKVELGSDGSLTLGYLSSCVREQISGGQVTVGEIQSEVSGGRVERTTVQCDGGRLSLAANEAMQSGAMALRQTEMEADATVTVHDVSPLFLLPKGGRLTIKRVDLTGERYKIRVPKGAGRTPLDFADHDIQLSAGGKYMASIGGHSVIFLVADTADRGEVATLGRIVPF